MKVKEWLKVTHIEDFFNLRVNHDFYDSTRDDEKKIKYVNIQDNGVVVIFTR